MSGSQSLYRDLPLHQWRTLCHTSSAAGNFAPTVAPLNLIPKRAILSGDTDRYFKQRQKHYYARYRTLMNFRPTPCISSVLVAGTAAVTPDSGILYGYYCYIFIKAAIRCERRTNLPLAALPPQCKRVCRYKRHTVRLKQHSKTEATEATASTAASLPCSGIS